MPPLVNDPEGEVGITDNDPTYIPPQTAVSLAESRRASRYMWIPDYGWEAEYDEDSKITRIRESSNKPEATLKERINYNPMDDLEKTQYKDDIDVMNTVMKAESPAQFEYYMKKAQYHKEQSRIMHEAPFLQQLYTDMESSLLDPIQLSTLFISAPAGTVAKVGRLSANLFMDLGAAAVSEGILQAQQEGRGASEAFEALGLGTGIATGAGLARVATGSLVKDTGNAVARTLTRGVDQQVVDRIAKSTEADLNADNIVNHSAGAAEVMDVQINRPGLLEELDGKLQRGEIDAQQYRDILRKERLNFLALKNPKLMKILGFASPQVRVASSQSIHARKIVDELADDLFLRNKDEYGVTVGASAENMSNKKKHVLMTEYHTSKDNGWREYKASGGNLKHSEWRTELGRAMVNNKHKDPTIDKAAKEIRANVMDVVQKQAVDSGILGENKWFIKGTNDQIERKENIISETEVTEITESIGIKPTEFKFEDGVSSLPRKKRKMTRLYRVESPTVRQKKTDHLKYDREITKTDSFWSTDARYIRSLHKEKNIKSDAKISYIDVPTNQVSQYRTHVKTKSRIERQQPSVEYVLPESAFKDKISKTKTTTKNPTTEYRQKLNDGSFKLLDPSQVEVRRVADVPVGDVKYFPRVWNYNYLLDHQKEFSNILEKNARDQFSERFKTKDPTADDLAELEEELQMLRENVWQFTRDVANTKDGYMGGSVVAKSARLHDRTLKIDTNKIQDFLVQDSDHVLSSYLNTIVPRIELTNRFGRFDMEDQLNTINKEFDELKSQHKDGSGGQAKIEKERASVIKDVTAMRDILLGEYGYHPNPKFNRYGKNIRTFNYVTKLGGVLLSSIPDIGTVIAQNGMKGVARQIGHLATDWKTLGLQRHQARVAGAALDRASDRAGSIWMGELDQTHKNKWDNAATQGAELMGKATGLNYWNDALKSTAVGIFNHEVGRIAHEGISKETRSWLARYGIDGDTLDVLKSQWKKHGAKENGIYLPNTDKWDINIPDVQRARDTYEAAMLRNANNSVITPSIGDQPLWTRSVLGKILSQFTSFTFAANNKMLLAMAQDPNINRSMGVIIGITLGGIANSLKDYAKGRDPDTDPASIIYRAIDASGVFGVPGEINNRMEDSIGLGLGPLFGADDPSYRGRGAAEFLGPTYGSADNAIKAAKIFSGDVKQSELNALRRLVPYNNLFYLDVTSRKLAEAMK